MRRSGVLLVMALLAAGCGGGTSAYLHRSIARARLDAGREFASAVVPQGAVKVSRDPSVRSALAAPESRCAAEKLLKYVVDDYGFWRIPGKPAEVWAWLRDHPAADADYRNAGSDPYGSKPVSWFVVSDFKNQQDVFFRALWMTLRPARGGGTALRVDATATASPQPDDIPCMDPY